MQRRLTAWRQPSARRPILSAGVVFVLAGLAIGLQTDFLAPPRYDGAGYAVLAESMRTGRGYRAIDHPEAPRHAHFPPGYPLALAALWSVLGPSIPAAHALSLACTATAVFLTWRWLIHRFAQDTAFLLACALALNWTWGRAGGAIRSEPLYLLLQALSLLACDWAVASHQPWRAFVLGLALAAAVLTRHAGVMLAAALFFELALRRRFSTLVVAVISFFIGVSPWLAWLSIVRENTQVSLFTFTELPALVSRLGLFYLQRIPDAILGPVIEFATVYRPAFAGWATFVAALATLIIALGWVSCSRNPRRRLAAMVPAATLALLLVWPFTEAGRFLIPLVPFILTGALEGGARVIRFARLPKANHPRTLAALLLIAVSLPCPLHGIATRRAAAAERLQRDFDDACRWIAAQTRRPGPVLVRQSGEAFWLMDRSRTALSPPADADTTTIEALVERHQVAFLLDDQERYTNAPPSSIEDYVRSAPHRVRLTWRAGNIVVYEVMRPTGTGGTTGRDMNSD